MAKITKLLCSTDNIRTLTHTPGSALEADEIALVNSLVCVAYADIAAAAAGEMIYQADEMDVPKAAVAIVEGDVAYWDAGAALFTNVVGSNTKCGVFIEAADSGDATARLELNNGLAL
jgi:predicted RecA/RadA family phage recombinase